MAWLTFSLGQVMDHALQPCRLIPTGLADPPAHTALHCLWPGPPHKQAFHVCQVGTLASRLS